MIDRLTRAEFSISNIDDRLLHHVKKIQGKHIDVEPEGDSTGNAKGGGMYGGDSKVQDTVTGLGFDDQILRAEVKTAASDLSQADLVAKAGKGQSFQLSSSFFCLLFLLCQFVLMALTFETWQIIVRIIFDFVLN